MSLPHYFAILPIISYYYQQRFSCLFPPTFLNYFFSLSFIFLSVPCYYYQKWWSMPFLSSFSTWVQGSFEHLHVFFLANCEWVKCGFSSLYVEEEFFKCTTITPPPLGKFDTRRPQLSQVPMCAIFSSYYFCNKVLAIVATCGEREYDTTTLVWCMGVYQLMMGDNEPAGLGLVVSYHDNASYLTKSLFSIAWHNSATFLMTLALVTGNFIIQKFFFLFIFFFPLLNRSFQGFSNGATSCYWALVLILTSPTSSHAFL